MKIIDLVLGKLSRPKMAAACWVIAAFDLFSMYTETTTYIVTDKRNLSIWGPPFLWIIAFLVVGSFGWGIWEKPFAFEPHSLKWAFAIEFGKETRALAPSQQQKKKKTFSCRQESEGNAPIRRWLKVATKARGRPPGGHFYCFAANRH